MQNRVPRMLLDGPWAAVAARGGEIVSQEMDRGMSVTSVGRISLSLSLSSKMPPPAIDHFHRGEGIFSAEELERLLIRFLVRFVFDWSANKRMDVGKVVLASESGLTLA